MSRIFISFSKDFNIALKLKTKLEEHGFDVWIYLEDIPPTADWLETIYRGILDSDIFLFLISPDSIISDTCNKEIIYAVDKGKRIIPVVIRKIDFNELPEGIKKLQATISFEKKGRFDQAFSELLKAIDTDFEWVQFTANLERKSLEWNNKKDSSRLLAGKGLQEAEEQLVNTGSKKDPPPTDLQRIYVLTSRKNDIRRRRQTTFGLTIGFIVMSILCIISVASSFIASSRENARATAQTIAEEQANIALARQLAAQSQLISLNAREDTVLSGLLAIESLKRYPSLDGDLAINRVLSILGYSTMLMDIGKVTAIAFSVDKELLVTGNSEGQIQVWNVKNGQELARMSQDAEVIDVSFSSDKKLVISGGSDNIVYVWDVAREDAIKVIHQEGSLSRLVVSPDGNSIAAMILLDTFEWEIVIQNIPLGNIIFRIPSDTNNTITPLAFNSDSNLLAVYDVNSNNETVLFIWDIKLNKEIAQFVSNSNGGWINIIKFSNTNKWIASGDQMGIVHVWDIETGEELFQTTIGLPVKDLVFSSDDNILAGANLCWRPEICGTSLSIWNISKKQQIANLQQPGGIYDLDITSNGNYLASAGGDGTARIWDVFTGQELGRMLHSSGVSTVLFNQNENSLISIDESGKLKTWWFGASSAGTYEIQENGITVAGTSPKGDNFVTINFDNVATVRNIATGQEVSSIQLKSQVYNVEFSSDGNWIASPYSKDDGSILIWDANTGKEIIQISHKEWISNITFSPDSSWLATSGNYFVCIWKLPSGEEKTCKQFDSTEFPYPPSELVFSPDGKSIAVTLGYSTQLLDTDTLQKITELSNGYATDPTFSPDGKLLATGQLAIGFGSCSDCSGHIWDISTGKEIFTLSPGGRVVSVEFSPNGEWLLTASQDGTAHVWDVATGQEVSKMIHDSGVGSATFSQDGRLVISGSDDGEVRVWEAKTGHEIARTTLTNKSLVKYVDFNNDSKSALIVSVSGIIKLWVWESQDLITELCTRLYRNMTQDEWKYYFDDEPYSLTCINLPAQQ